MIEKIELLGRIRFTTSVYTEADGGWVTEDSPTEPSSRRGQWAYAEMTKSVEGKISRGRIMGQGDHQRMLEGKGQLS